MENQTKPEGNTDVRYLVISVGTSLAPVLAEVKGKLPKDFSDYAKCFALDTNDEIMKYQETADGITPILMGKESRKGKGCGGKKALGKAAFEESKEELLTAFGDLEKIRGVILFITVGRGGTGTGACISLCQMLREKIKAVVLFIFRPSVFALEAGPGQMADFNEVRTKLYELGIKFACLNQDWIYETQELKKLSLKQARSRMNEKIAETIAKVSVFYTGRGEGYIDPGDLEEQVLSGAGNWKLVTTPLNLAAQNPKQEIDDAVKRCLDEKLFELRGPVQYVVSFRQNEWGVEHQAALGPAIDAYCKQSLKDWSEDANERGFQVDPEKFLYNQKQVDLEPEDLPQVELEKSSFFRNDFNISSQVSISTVAEPHESVKKMGALTLLISTFVPSDPKSAGASVEMLPEPKMLTNGHAGNAVYSSQPLLPAAETPLTFPASAKLSKVELDEAKRLHSEVFQGSKSEEELTLTYVAKRIERTVKPAMAVVEKMEPAKFYRLLNHIRREAKLTEYTFEWAELSSSLDMFSRNAFTDALWENHKFQEEFLPEMPKHEQPEKVWIMHFVEVAKSAQLHVPTHLYTATNGKKEVSSAMSAVDLENLAAVARSITPQERKLQQELMELARLKKILRDYFKDIIPARAAAESHSSVPRQWGSLFSRKKDQPVSITQ